MGKGTATEQRRERTRELLRILGSENVEKMNLSVRGLTSYFAEQWGLRVETVKSYFSLLYSLGLVKSVLIEGKRTIRITEQARKRLAEEDAVDSTASIEKMYAALQELDEKEEEKTAKTERSPT